MSLLLLYHPLPSSLSSSSLFSPSSISHFLVLLLSLLYILPPPSLSIVSAILSSPIHILHPCLPIFRPALPPLPLSPPFVSLFCFFSPSFLFYEHFPVFPFLLLPFFPCLPFTLASPLSSTQFSLSFLSFTFLPFLFPYLHSCPPILPLFPSLPPMLFHFLSTLFTLSPRPNRPSLIFTPDTLSSPSLTQSLHV